MNIDPEHQTVLAVIHTDNKQLISAEMSFLISTPYKTDQIFVRLQASVAMATLFRTHLKWQSSHSEG